MRFSSPLKRLPVIPAKAGIQKRTTKRGFPLTHRARTRRTLGNDAPEIRIEATVRQRLFQLLGLHNSTMPFQRPTKESRAWLM